MTRFVNISFLKKSIFSVNMTPPTKKNLFKLIVKVQKKKFFSVFFLFDHHHLEDSIRNFFLTYRAFKTDIYRVMRILSTCYTVENSTIRTARLVKYQSCQSTKIPPKNSRKNSLPPHGSIHIPKCAE